MLRQVITIVISLSIMMFAFSGCIKTDEDIKDKNDQAILEETTANEDIEDALYEEVDDLEALEKLEELESLNKLIELEELAKLAELEELEELIELEEIIESLEE